MKKITLGPGPVCLRTSADVMPTSRPGSEPVEFWVDGSRRDGTVEEFYTLSSELGEADQKPYAIKVLRKRSIDKKIVRTEIGVLLRLSHPNIVSMRLRPQRGFMT
uniref:Protein kinase domain-containing protein n=1 Tax=Labrus bergylta TaxID=56723 RepID=A0A3Q3EUU8_9LABR